MAPAATLAMAAGGSRRLAALASRFASAASPAGRRGPLTRDRDLLVPARSTSLPQPGAPKPRAPRPLAPFSLLPFSTGAGSGRGNNGDYGGEAPKPRAPRLLTPRPLVPFSLLPFSTGAGSGRGNNGGHGGKAVKHVANNNAVDGSLAKAGDGDTAGVDLGAPRGLLSQVGDNLQDSTNSKPESYTVVDPLGVEVERTEEDRGKRSVTDFGVNYSISGKAAGDASDDLRNTSTGEAANGIRGMGKPKVSSDDTKNGVEVDPRRELTGEKVGKRPVAAVDGNNIFVGGKGVQEELPTSDDGEGISSTDSFHGKAAVDPDGGKARMNDDSVRGEASSESGDGVENKLVDAYKAGCCCRAVKEIVAVDANKADCCCRVEKLVPKINNMFIQHRKNQEKKDRSARITHTVIVLFGVLAELVALGIVFLVWGVSYVVELARDKAIALSGDEKTKEAITNVMDQTVWSLTSWPKRALKARAEAKAKLEKKAKAKMEKAAKAEKKAKEELEKKAKAEKKAAEALAKAAKK